MQHLKSLSLLFLTGCSPSGCTRAPSKKTEGKPPEGEGGQVASALLEMASYGIWLSGIAIVAAIVFAWRGKPKMAAFAGASALGLWVAAWAAEKASIHLDLIGWTLAVGALGVAALFIWARRVAIRNAIGDLPGTWDDNWENKKTDDHDDRRPPDGGDSPP